MRPSARPLSRVLALAWVVFAGPVAAQPAESSLTALPGMHRVSVPHVGAADVSATALVGYGGAFGVLADGDSHHRAHGGVAVSVRATDWLAASLNLRGRYDNHNNAPTGDDDGWISEASLCGRGVTTAAALSLSWGSELCIELPGGDSVSRSFSGVSVSARALASRALTPRLTVAANLGFRLDRSAESAPDADTLSPPDRLVLGVSDANRVLVGAGVSYQVGAFAVVGEVTWDALVGADTQGLGRSPLRFTGGARTWLSDSIGAHVTAEVNAAQNPDVTVGEPLVPFEPRFGIVAGLQFVWGAGGGTAGDGDAVGGDKDSDSPPPPTTATLKVYVVGNGAPVAATVVVTGGSERFSSDAPEGEAVFSDVPPGSVTVTATAEGYPDKEVELVVQAGEARDIEIALEAELPPGQLRGVVQSLRGRPLAATLEIEPGGHKVKTDKSGFFEIDLPPGDYEVEIKAKRFGTQRRTISIEQNGVTILNVDLRRRR